MLLSNNLTNICNEISKIRMNILMTYTCNVKGFEEVEKMDRRWMHFASVTKIFRYVQL